MAKGDDPMKYTPTGEVILSRREKWRMEETIKNLEANLDYTENEIRRLQARVEQLERELGHPHPRTPW